MAVILKQGKSDAERYEADQAVQAVVRDILEELRVGGEVAARQLSLKFDNWGRARFQLSEQQIVNYCNF